jgi:hypothetical protein
VHKRIAAALVALAVVLTLGGVKDSCYWVNGRAYCPAFGNGNGMVISPSPTYTVPRSTLDSNGVNGYQPYNPYGH